MQLTSESSDIGGIPSFIDRHEVECTGISSTCPQAECEVKLKYRNVRYHLLVAYNDDFPESIENKYLQKVDDAYENECGEGDLEVGDQAVYNCSDLFWKFIKEHDDGIGRDDRATCEDVGEGEDTVVKMQVKTVEGCLQVFEHDRIYRKIVNPIENPFPDLRVFQKAEVHRIEDMGFELYKVMIGGEEYFLKTVYSRDEATFLKELAALRNMPRHPNIIPLIGVVATEDERIEGFVTPYINGTNLYDVTSASEEQKNVWKQVITDAIALLHERDLVWGDVKAANIMIEGKTNRPVLVDFGGGSTKGWIDHNLTEKREGDLQGLKRIVDFIDNMK